MAKAQKPVLSPNYGVYLGQPSITIPQQGLEDCLNVRVHNLALESNNHGWEKFDTQVLNGVILGADVFKQTNGSRDLVFATKGDLYRYDEGTAAFMYITPTYEVGTAACAGGTTTVTGSGGTLWNSGLSPIAAGDEIAFSATQYDPTATWFVVASVTNDTTLVLTANGPNTGGAVAYTIRKKFAGGDTDVWTFETFPREDLGSGNFGDRWYATNNGVDYVVRWDGTSAPAVEQTALDLKAKYIRRFKNMMIYANLTIVSTGAAKPLSFINSDVGQPIDVTDGLAQEFVVSPSASHILAAVPLGDELAIYTESEVVLSSFIGGDIVFVFRTVIHDTGLLAKRLVARFSDHHEFLAADNLYSFNGVQAEPKDQHIWREVNRSIDAARLPLSHVFFDEERGDLVWAVTLTTDAGSATSPVQGPDTGYAAHYLEIMPLGVPTPYTIRECPFSATTEFVRSGDLTWDQVVGNWDVQTFQWDDKFFAAAFPLILAGGASGVVMSLFTKNTKDGSAMVGRALFPMRAIGDIRHRNLMSRVYLMVDQGTTDYDLTVTTLFFDHMGQATPAITQVDMFDLALAGEQFVYPYRVGRYAQVQFSTDGSTAGQPWRMWGYDFDIRPGGW